VGSNRDEFVVVRKMKKVDWMEGPLDENRPAGIQGSGAQLSGKKGSAK
jgi:nitrate reductase alpha subunit